MCVAVMSYPAEGMESAIKNHIDDVRGFLDTRHPNHYAVYNLSQRTYRVIKFQNRVSIFQIWDGIVCHHYHLALIWQPDSIFAHYFNKLIFTNIYIYIWVSLYHKAANQCLYLPKKITTPAIQSWPNHVEVIIWKWEHSQWQHTEVKWREMKWNKVIYFFLEQAKWVYREAELI